MSRFVADVRDNANFGRHVFIIPRGLCVDVTASVRVRNMSN